jgi:hypothetical protein
MNDYYYERGSVDDAMYAIENPHRVDADGNQIRIALEIQAALPGVVFRTYADGSVFRVQTDEALTPAQIETLGALVETHKANG